MDPIMDSNNKVCRACLGCCPQEYYSLSHGSPSYQFKLQECVPFMDFNVILDPIICVTCAAMLDRSYQLLIVARNVESRLSRYMEESCCVGACYIMAHKPVDGLLECLRYHTIVDDTYNFRMVVAVAAKVEPDGGLQGTIKVEDVDQDYDDTESMPNIDLMSAFPPVREGSLSPLLIPFLPASHSPDHNDIDSKFTNDTPPPATEMVDMKPAPPTTPVRTTINDDVGEEGVPYKIFIRRPKTPDPTTSCNEIEEQEDKTAPVLLKESRKRSGKHRSSRKVQECPECHSLFGNLKSHLRVHVNGEITTLNNVMPAAAAPIEPQNKCVQCDEDYSKSDTHKCLFSSYVRLERIRTLDDLAMTYRRTQLYQQRRLLKQRITYAFPRLTDGNTVNATRTIDDISVSNSLTLSAMSGYDEDEQRIITEGGQQVFRCSTCQLRFDNAVQLARHANLNHGPAHCDGTSQNLIDRLKPLAILDEHSYAWIKSIQCWNCSWCFTTRENWLVHDFKQHRSSFLICYICFRGYKHSQIISHIANTHSLPMEVNNFFRMLNRRLTSNSQVTDIAPPGKCMLDDTYTRMSRFIMLEYKMIHCPLCQRPCGNTSLLIRHLVLNRCTLSSCLLCHVQLASSFHLIDHLMTKVHRRNVVCAANRALKTYMCQVCDSVFQLETAFYSHSCFDDTNPFVMYRHKMGLWSCAECFVMSPFGMSAKLQHVLSALHLRNRLDRLANLTINATTDLNCHLCTETTAFTSTPALIQHLVSEHIEGLSVLCPLCHYMALNPENFTLHLEIAHPEFPLAQMSSDTAVLTETSSAGQYPDEFTCLLCARIHWTLNSFWMTCGKGHAGCTFSFDKILKYLEMFDAERWLQFNGDDLMYNCECGRIILNSRQLYKHHRYLPGAESKVANCCTFWAYCEVCGALVSPRDKLREHTKREHSTDSSPKARIRCKNQLELTTQSIKEEPLTSVDEAEMPLLGKRKRRKTQLFIEMEANGGLLAMDKKLEQSIQLYSEGHRATTKRPRTKSQSILKQPVEFFDVFADADRINDRSMQPFVQLEMLPAGQFDNTVVAPCKSEDVMDLTKDSGNATLHMMEAIERVVFFNDLRDDKDVVDEAGGGDDGDDGRSSCSSGFNLSSLLAPDELDLILQEDSQSRIQTINAMETILSTNSKETSNSDSLLCHETVDDNTSSDNDSFIQVVDISDDEFNSDVIEHIISIDDLNNSELSQLNDIHNMKERERRSQLAALFKKLSIVLKPEGYSLGTSRVSKKDILSNGLQTIKNLEGKLKSQESERDQWLNIVEVKEAVLKELRLEVVLRASGNKNGDANASWK